MSLASALRGVALATSLLAVAVGSAGAQGAEWSFADARVLIDLRADGSADVSMTYTLAAAVGTADASDEPVPLALLGFQGATSRHVDVEGQAVPIVLWPVSGSRRVAAIRVPDDGVLELNYTVANALEEDGPERSLRVPLLTGPIPAPDAAGFEIEVRVPDDWRVQDAFPSRLRSADGRITGSLPVVPAVVLVRARTDGAWRPGLPDLVDLITLVVLAGFCLVGWRHLRSVVEENR